MTTVHDYLYTELYRARSAELIAEAERDRLVRELRAAARERRRGRRRAGSVPTPSQTPPRAPRTHAAAAGSERPRVRV